jgi:DNA repair exonuclease SbcCD ATPase subunit
MTSQEIINEFAGAKANYNLLSKQLSAKKEQMESLKKQVEIQSKARWVLTEVAQNTQKRFKDRVESLVTMAIQSVFDRPLHFCLEIERNRNKMECRMLVKELVDGQERIYSDAEEDIAGGLIDVMSFALRIVLWSLQNPKSRNVMIFDEPMKNMGKLISLGGQVLKEISHKLNFQIIMITHDESLMEIADRSYQVTHDGNKSSIHLIKGINYGEGKSGLCSVADRKLGRNIKINREVG